MCIPQTLCRISNNLQCAYLRHYAAYLVYALYDRLAAPRHSNGPFGGVRQHFAGNLHRESITLLAIIGN